MSIQDRISAASARIATATSVLRTRREDEGREGRHGEALNGLVVARKLEKIAERLESLIA